SRLRSISIVCLQRIPMLLIRHHKVLRYRNPPCRQQSSSDLSHRLRALVLCDGSRCHLSRCRCMVDKRLVTKRPPKLQPSWSATSTTNIASFDRTAVLQLLHHRLRRPFNDILHPRDAFPQPATTCVRSAARRHWIHD